MPNYGLIAYMNYGRWIFHCPRCSSALLASETGVICPVCWPGIRAKAFNRLSNGLFRPVPDTELIEAEQAKAQESGEVYFPIFPKERPDIETILKLRPLTQNMNWEPGETLDILNEQNIAHGDPVQPERKG